MITERPKFHETAQHEPWQNKVAAELNRILSHAESVARNATGKADADFVNAARSIVWRVAEFEEIRTESDLEA